MLHVDLQWWYFSWNVICDHTEVRVSADAVSLLGPEVRSDAEEPQDEIRAGDEDERIPL